MHSRTKIIVLHVRELIYTGIFILFGILLIILLFFMFSDQKSEPKEDEAEQTQALASYIPGVYTTSLILNDQTVDIQMTVDASQITDIRMVHLEDTVTTMYPLLKPAFQNLADQILDKQSLTDITYDESSQYTSMVLLNTISQTLEKAIPVSQTDTLTKEP